MRKKFLVCLMLMACVLMQAMPVMAAGELTVAQLESLPKPEDGAYLISFADLQKNGDSYVYPATDEVRLSNLYGECKVIVYNVGSGLFWYQTGTEITVDDDGPVVMYNKASTSSLKTALENSVVLPKLERFDSFTSNAYVMFFDSNASSLDDIKCCVSAQAIVSYYEPYNAGGNVKGGDNKFTVSVVEKTPEDAPTSAKFRLDYELNSGDDFWGEKREEKLAKVFVDTLSCIYIDESVRESVGSLEFVLTDLHVGTYNIELRTDRGNKYYTSFDVDFEGVGQDGFSQYTGSYDAPVVSFDGVPDASVSGLLEPVVITARTDIPSEFTFGTSEYSGYTTENEITLLGNGDYRYRAISEVGKVTEGILSIKCFDDNVSIAMSGQDLAESDGRLVQTGINNSNETWAYILIIGVLCAVPGVVLLKRRFKA